MSLLHTIVPLETVLAGLDWPGAGAAPGPGLAAAGATAALPAVRMVALGGGRYLEVAAGPDGETVRRLHSPQPADYLLAAYQPGAPYRG